MTRLLQCLLLFTKAGINPREIARQVSRIDDNSRVRRWLHRCSSARKGSTRLVVETGKFLTITEVRHDAGIVGTFRGRLLLNLNDLFVEAPLVVELARSREGDGLVLGIRRSFRQNLGSFVESTFRL